MWRALRFGLVATVLGAIALTFLGVVSFQNGDAMSAMHQRGVLKSFHKVLTEDINAGLAKGDLSGWLNGNLILRSPDVTALVIDETGNLVAQSWQGGMPEPVRLVLEQVQAGDEAKGQDKQIDMDMARFVWFEGPIGASGQTLLMIHECMNMPMVGLTELYILPFGIGVLMVIWLGFWATVISMRMIRNQDKVAAMELELVREQESGRIKSAFFANMSHELRTPLNAIIGFAELMKAEVFGSLGSDRNREYIKDIHVAGKSLMSLLGNLLALSSIEAGKTELEEREFELAYITDGILAGNANAITERNLDVRVDRASADARLWGDAVRVERAFCNILHNATTYTSEGGRIDINCRVDESDRVCIEIRDEGCGMDEQKLALVLSGQSHTENNAHHAKDGPGLGLPLSRALLDLHGATLDIESIAGQGTSVRVTFPPERTLPPARPEATEPIPSPVFEPEPERLAS